MIAEFLIGFIVFGVIITVVYVWQDPSVSEKDKLKHEILHLKKEIEDLQKELDNEKRKVERTEESLDTERRKIRTILKAIEKEGYEMEYCDWYTILKKVKEEKE